MFSKLLIAAGAIALSAAFILAAGTISVSECSDKECKTDCKVIAHYTQGTCSKEHFGHGSFKATCKSAPAGCMEVYGGIFSKNATAPCSDYNVKMLGPRQCGVCFENHMKQMMKVDCPATGSNVTLHVDCDKACTTCKHTISIKEKTCNRLPGPMDFDFGYSVPESCHSMIDVAHYPDDDCSGSEQRDETQFSNSCYGWGGPDGKGNSRYYDCSQ
jgi:hypothetical protein